MKASFPLICSLALSGLLTACVTVHQEPLPVKTQRTYSAITSHSDAFSPQPGETFAWFDDAITVSEGGGLVPPHIRQLLTESLQTELIEKGFRVASSPSTADFMIGAGVLFKDAEQSEDMLNFIQVFPAIRETLDEEQPVSLLVAAGRPDTLTQHQLMWRGAANASVLTSPMPEAERQTLVRDLVESLLNSFP